MRYNIIVIAMISLSIVMSGCDIEWNDDNESEPITLTKAEAEMTGDVNRLGFDVFNALNVNKPGDNLFISPMSLSLALSMTAAGACGQTAEQMCCVLGFNGYSITEVNDYFHKIVTGMAKSDKNTKFKSANSIWAAKYVTLKDSFTADVSRYYNAEVNNVDFSKSSTLRDINNWCSKHTEGKIKKIKKDVDPNTALALINALYFNGTWTNEFDGTSDEIFTDINGKAMKESLMQNTSTRRYCSSDRVQMVQIPYGNGNFVMDVILPDSDLDFKKFVSCFNTSEWKALCESLRETVVDLAMPSFKMEYSADLKDILGGLGMSLAVSPMADFSGMTDYKVFIDEVLQKCYVDVNRRGTEAAAVTYIGMELTSAGPTNEVVMVVDRPFMFVIRELTSGVIIFVGQYVGQ